MNRITARCGHAVVAVGAPGSPARIAAERSDCLDCARFSVTTFGNRLDGTRGITGIIGGLTAHSVQDQITNATRRGDTVVIIDSTGRTCNPADFAKLI